MILYSIIFLFFVIIWSVRKFSTLFNPVTLLTIGILLPTLSLSICERLDLLRGRNLMLADTACMYNLIGLFSFLIPWIRYKDFGINNTYSKIISNDILLKGCKYLCFFTFCTLVFAFFFLGGVPFFKMISGSMNVEEYNLLLNRLPLGIIAIIGAFSTILYFHFASFIFNRSREGISKIFLFFLILICLFSSLWQGKRQGLLLFLFVIISFFFQRFKIKLNLKTIKILFVSLVFLLMFFVIFTNVGSVRNNSNETNQFELLEYAMYAPMNWSYMTELFSPYGTVFFPSVLLFEIVPRRLGSGLADYRDYLFEPTSPSGYFSYWYADYGVIGIVFGGLLIGFVSKYYYKKRYVSELHMYLYLLVLWCCATISIYSHLLTITLYIKIIVLKIYFFILFKKNRKSNLTF